MTKQAMKEQAVKAILDQKSIIETMHKEWFKKEYGSDSWNTWRRMHNDQKEQLRGMVAMVKAIGLLKWADLENVLNYDEHGIDEEIFEIL